MEPRLGDIILVETDHFTSKLIRFGQRGYGPWAKWNHCAVYVGHGDIVEALTHGVVKSKLSKYAAAETMLLPVEGNDEMRSNAAAFALSCVGQEYGFLTIFNIALKTLFKGRFNFSISGQDICSGVAAKSAERCGYNWNPYEPAELMPAYLGKALHAP